MSPWDVHFDSHKSAEIARHVCGQVERHQKESFRFFSNHPEQRFSVGERIFVMNQRHTFHKASQVFHPTFSSEKKVVRFVDKRYLPWIYHISSLDSDAIEKKLYAFQMLKDFGSDMNSSKTTKLSEYPVSSENTDIVVLDVINQPTDLPTLRSGRKIKGKSVNFYRILLGGKQDIVTVKGLRLLLKTFGNSSLKYGKFFDLPENRHFKLNA